jgi:hypothetical protein
MSATSKKEVELHALMWKVCYDYGLICDYDLAIFLPYTILTVINFFDTVEITRQVMDKILKPLNNG